MREPQPKRLEFSKVVTRVVVAVAFLGVLIFLSEASLIKNMRFGVVRLYKPVGVLLGKFSKNTLGLGNYVEDERVVGRIKELEFEIGILKSENAKLSNALKFVTRMKNPPKGARTFSYYRELGREFLLIDAGEEAGIKNGDLVFNDSFVFLGIVRVVGGGFSKVDIASNKDNTFEVKLVPLGGKALARGLGSRTFSVELIPTDTPIQVSDFLSIPSDSGDKIFAEVVRERMTKSNVFKEAWATLLVRPEVVDLVFVVSPPF